MSTSSKVEVPGQLSLIPPVDPGPPPTSPWMAERARTIAAGEHPISGQPLLGSWTCGTCRHHVAKLNRRGRRVAFKCGLTWDGSSTPLMRDDCPQSLPACVEWVAP